MNLPTKKQRTMSRHVLNDSMKIADVAKAFAVSPSTVRRALDACTEFDCAEISLKLRGGQWAEILGWLNNGNTTAQDLAADLTDRLITH